MRRDRDRIERPQGRKGRKERQNLGVLASPAPLRSFWSLLPGRCTKLAGGRSIALEAELARSVCRLVAGLVVSDDDFAPEEEAFIERMLARFEVADREAI